MSRFESANPSAGISREVVAESDTMRFTLYTIEPGSGLPWHRHSEVSDWYFCREGSFLVEIREPAESWTLTPGAMASVPVGRAHRVVNTGLDACSFALVQEGGRYDFNPVDE